LHPLLTHPSRLALYSCAWLVNGVTLAALLRSWTLRPWLNAFAFALPASVLFGFIALSTWWVCRAHPLAESTSDALRVQLGAAAQASLVWAGVGALLGTLLSNVFGIDSGPLARLQDALVLFFAGIPMYLISAAAHYLLIGHQNSIEAESRALEAEISAREAELRELRAQLNPHFLFNSLHSINALIGTDPEGARRMCERLGDFLRRTLALGARDTVTLAEELSLVDRYLDIEQMRFGDRLRVERTIGAASLRCLVPPLLLQPLVENAIKHGIQNCSEEGVVHIEAQQAQGRLLITIDSPLDVDAPVRKGEGLGLENVRRRIHAMGMGDGRMSAEPHGTSFRVTLALPLIEEAKS
jgi:hypothetical protein